MARVLLHTLVFAPDSNSTAYLMTDLAEELKRLGHTATVLTTTPHNNLQQERLDRQPRIKVWGGLLYRSDYKGMTIWHANMPLKGENVSARLKDYLRFQAISLMGILKIGSYDIVIAPSPPLTVGVVAWAMGVLRRAPSVYNVQEVYPDFAINQGVIRNPTMIRILRRVERFVYARNTKIVPISDWFGRTIQERGVPAYKLETIPNFVGTELYRPLPRRNEFSEKHGLIDQFVVLYGGNTGLSQDWESLLYAAQEVANLPIQFVIVGDGVSSKWLKDEIARRGLKNVQMLGYQPRELMPLINASSDLCIIPMKTDTTRDTFPSKIYTIMACGKSTLVSADADSELEWLINRFQCGRVVPPDDPRAFADAVLQAFHNRNELVAEGERGYLAVQEEYSKEAVGRKYDTLIRALTQKLNAPRGSA